MAKEAQSVEPAEKGPEKPQLPKIKAILSKDLMTAKLCVEPVGAPEEPLTFDDIVTALHHDGVIFGIDDKAIAGVVEKWQKLKRYYEVDAVAKGSPPQPGKEGGWDTDGQIYSDPKNCRRPKNPVLPGRCLPKVSTSNALSRGKRSRRNNRTFLRPRAGTLKATLFPAQTS